MTTSFIDLGVSAPIAAALAKRGITAPFPVQTMAVPDALAGRDVLVRSRTGSGKTLAFAIPLVERMSTEAWRPCALILTPTRELASQVAAELTPLAAAKHMRVALAYGGTSIGEQIRNVKKAHIIVATPGRLEDMLQRNAVSLKSIKILVLDEADHMLDMGFLPQVDKIVARTPADRQTMLFSATLDGEVGRIARDYTRDPVRHQIASPPATSDVEHHFFAVSHDGKTDRLADLLVKETASTLVFVRTKHGADRLVRKLAAHGIEAAAMHGDKTQAARERALARFSQGRVAALVATDVAARGLDVDGIARVINYDAPGDDKAFVHRVGRTGRAGRTGTSITFVAPEQRQEIGKMAERLRLHEEFAKEHGTLAPGPRNGTRPGRHSAPRRSGGARVGGNRRRSR